MTCTRRLIILAALVVLPCPALFAQAPAPASQRFTFMVPNGSKAGPGGEDRFELIVERWSSDAERDRMLAVFKTEGQQNLSNAIRDAYMAGWINLPGGLVNVVRYARRSPRVDGGEDIVLVFDWRTWAWWDPSLPSSPLDATFSVIQLRLNKAGIGEGRLAVGKLREDKAAGIAMADYDGQPALLLNYNSLPVLLLDVRRSPPSKASDARRMSGRDSSLARVAASRSGGEAVTMRIMYRTDL